MTGEFSISAGEAAALVDLFEKAPCGYLCATSDGVIDRVNATFLSWTGYAREQLVGRQFKDLLNPASVLFYETRYLPVLQLQGEVREATLMIAKADGELFPILINAALAPADSPDDRVIRIAVFDATNRQNYERDLMVARRHAEESESRLRHMQQAATAFGAADSPDAVASELARIAREAFDATATSVLLLNPSGNLQPATPYPLPRGSVRDLSIESSALKSGRPLTFSDAQSIGEAFPGVDAAMQRARLESAAVAPLLSDSTAFGTLSCYFGRGRTFSTDNLNLLMALCRQAGQALQRLELQAQLQHSALHDALTGLANRELLQTELARALSASGRHQRPLSLIFVDLDGFKRINDELGHARGDALLRDVATRLLRVVRGSDTLARFGGDEFVVVCEETGEAAAERVAERILQTVAQPIHGVPSAYTVSASIGIAVHTPVEGRATPTAAAILSVADKAMYESKNSGKNTATLLAV